MASVVSTCCWAAYACDVHERSCASVANRALARRWAAEGVRSSTIILWPPDTAPRGSPTSPRQLTAGRRDEWTRPPAETASTSATASTAIPDRIVSRDLMCGTRIQGKVVGVRDGVGIAPRGGDHRRVVGAERERRECGAGQRGAEL